MSDLPFPGLDTLQKLQGWAGKEFTTLMTILREGPLAFLEGLQGKLEENFVESLRFFTFVILTCFLISVPIDYALWRIDVFNVGSAASGLILSILLILVFCLSLHTAARIMKSKADLKMSLTAMFFASAYLPLLEASKYLDRIDPVGRQMLQGPISPELITEATTRPLLVVGYFIQMTLIGYIIFKLIGVVKYTYGFRRLRAMFTIGIAGIVYTLVVNFIAGPIWAEVVKQGART